MKQSVFPLYYCSECLRAVKVITLEGHEPRVERPCTTDCNTAQIIAPRKAIAAGKGGLNMQDKAKMTYLSIAAALTGRCV
jgi:hypothetical protein